LLQASGKLLMSACQFGDQERVSLVDFLIIALINSILKTFASLLINVSFSYQLFCCFIEFKFKSAAYSETSYLSFLERQHGTKDLTNCTSVD
jgi:hypothetical protein